MNKEHKNRRRKCFVQIPALLIILIPLPQAVRAEGPDYAAFGAALGAHVDGEGGVDYKGLKANTQNLDAYLNSIARLEPGAYQGRTEEEKIAFWINAYNGLTLKAIIDRYPIQASFTKSILYPKISIRQIEGVWDKLQFNVMGRPMTLEGIEHGELRAKFNEPRIHAALVCAAKSCPPLRNEPYLGSKLNEQLDDQMRAFLSNPAKFTIDSAKGVVWLSEIFKWFGEDFVSKYGTETKFQGFDDIERAILNAVSGYLQPEARAFLERGGYKIEYLDYDWSLNER